MTAAGIRDIVFEDKDSEGRGENPVQTQPEEKPAIEEAASQEEEESISTSKEILEETNAISKRKIEHIS